MKLTTVAAVDPVTIMMPGTAAITTIVSDPDQCLSASMLDAAGLPEAERARVSMRVRAAMRALAEDGFVPLASAEDKAAEVISLANVGLVVPHGATAPSVPPRAWAARTDSGERAKAVLLPSSHRVISCGSCSLTRSSRRQPRAETPLRLHESLFGIIRGNQQVRHMRRMRGRRSVMLAQEQQQPALHR